jgi:hypothetical protein
MLDKAHANVCASVNRLLHGGKIYTELQANGLCWELENKINVKKKSFNYMLHSFF